ncbi:hypothetical protein A2U01_0041635, partial [Trifolium medium]|nr:hypothetical protein [Trifolium medium]
FALSSISTSTVNRSTAATTIETSGGAVTIECN